MIQNVYSVLPYARVLSLCDDLSFGPCADIDGFHADFFGSRHRSVYAGVLLLAVHHLVRFDRDLRVEPCLSSAHVEYVVVEDHVVDEKIVTVDDITASVAVLFEVGIQGLDFFSVLVV